MIASLLRRYTLAQAYEVELLLRRGIVAGAAIGALLALSGAWTMGVKPAVWAGVVIAGVVFLVLVLPYAGVFSYGIGLAYGFELGEQITEDVLYHVDLDDICGVSEIAKLLSTKPYWVTNNQVRMWASRRANNGFPMPLRDLIGGPLYSRRQVWAWWLEYRETPYYQRTMHKWM